MMPKIDKSKVFTEPKIKVLRYLHQHKEATQSDLVKYVSINSIYHAEELYTMGIIAKMKDTPSSSWKFIGTEISDKLLEEYEKYNKGKIDKWF